MGCCTGFLISKGMVLAAAGALIANGPDDSAGTHGKKLEDTPHETLRFKYCRACLRCRYGGAE
jgi:hypothetical protein